jgi:hypothetical protein
MYYHNQGYSRGGLDVTTAVNMFFKFLLLSPVFLLAGYVSIAMMKHMIFHGVPVMNQPTEEQIQNIKERDESIGVEVPVVTPDVPVVTEVTPRVTEEVIVPKASEIRSDVVVREEVPVSRLDRALNEVTGESTYMREYCIGSWLPRYGTIPAARGGMCDRYR